MPPKGELEIVYGSPWGGVDYSRPYNAIDPQFLAPGSVNTSQVNGFLTSAPWVAASPYTTAFVGNEYVLGTFQATAISPNLTGSAYVTTIIVTNVAVYLSGGATLSGGMLIPAALVLLHTWVGGITPEVNASYLVPGNAVSFVQVNGIVYFTGIMLNGVFSYDLGGAVFATATTYVSASYIIELGGRLFAAQCRFPTGGGTGTNVLPTVAWSGAGEYAGSGGSDPWNPVNNLGGGFNELADVPDQITGLALVGRSALIFRTQGVSQADPNPGTSNSGIQPFDFYHLWASPQGVGATAGSVAQYGQTVAFYSLDNIYTISISGGLQVVGPRIIPKINADFRSVQTQVGLRQGAAAVPSQWYFASFVIIAGQLHYLLQWSAYYGTPNQSVDTPPLTKAVIYDFNMSENAWHVCDLMQYIQQAGGPQPFLALSCPITQTSESFPASSGLASIMVSQPYILIGAYTFLGTIRTHATNGGIFQLVPWDYDYASQWILPFNAGLYAPVSMPLTNIVFRAEVISLGHKITTRRMRVQADNAPLPAFDAGSNQQAVVTFTGALPTSVQNTPLAWTLTSGQTVPYMQGNNTPNGAPIQTYYGNAVISDELVQPSIAGKIANPAAPWDSLPAFRIATASLVCIDTQGTTQ